MEDSTQIIDDPFEAVKSSNLSLLKASLQNRVDINIQDTNGMTLLHHAINSNHVEIVKYLLKNGADVTKVDNNGETTLHIAASKNQLKIANILLENINHHELKKFIDAKTTILGTTALHITSASGYLEMTRLMLNHGATYDSKNKKSKRPVDVTKDQATGELLKQVNVNFELARVGNEKLYEILEKCPIENYPVFVNARNNDDYNIVQIAMINNHTNLTTLIQCSKVALFRVNGHKPTFDGNYFDELLLLATKASKSFQDENCTMEKSLENFRKFISIFRSIDKRISDPNILAIEETLKLSDHHENASSFEALTKQVIDVHLKLFSASIYSVKLLETTRQKNWLEAEKCMMGLAYVNFCDDGGWTPLLHAVNAGNVSMVKMLLDHGARVNCWTKTGRNTSLHVAVNKGQFKIVEMLLEKDSTSEFVNARTEAKGSTALHVAVKAGLFDIVIWLLKCGAKYCLKNKDDMMPMDLVNDEKMKMLFGLIGEFFDDVKNGRVDVIDKLGDLSDDEFLAVVLCQNEDGRLLKDVALFGEHEEIASKITDMLRLLLEDKGFKFNEN